MRGALAVDLEQLLFAGLPLRRKSYEPGCGWPIKADSGIHASRGESERGNLDASFVEQRDVRIQHVAPCDADQDRRGFPDASPRINRFVFGVRMQRIDLEIERRRDIAIQDAGQRDLPDD